MGKTCLQEDQKFGFKHFDMLNLRCLLDIKGTC